MIREGTTYIIVTVDLEFVCLQILEVVQRVSFDSWFELKAIFYGGMLFRPVGEGFHDVRHNTNVTQVNIAEDRIQFKKVLRGVVPTDDAYQVRHILKSFASTYQVPIFSMFSRETT